MFVVLKNIYLELFYKTSLHVASPDKLILIGYSTSIYNMGIQDTTPSDWQVLAQQPLEKTFYICDQRKAI